MKKVLNLRVSTVLNFALPAAMMLLTAVSELTGRIPEAVLNVLSLCMLALWTATAVLSRRRGEPADERAIKNMTKAFTLCFMVLVLAGAAAGLYCSLSGRAIALTVPVIFLLLAGVYLLYAVLFLVFDRRGD